MKERFCDYIHTLRIKSNLTLTKLAAALDLDQSTLSKIENGKRSIPASLLPKLATHFDIDLALLEKEYYSEQIANIIYPQENSTELLKLAEEKAKYFRTINHHQSQIKF